MIMEHLGDRIKKRADELNISQNKLAKLVGIGQGAMSKIFNGATTNPRKLNEIAKILGVSSDWIMTGEETTPNTKPADIDVMAGIEKMNTYPLSIPIYGTAAGSEVGTILINDNQIIAYARKMPTFGKREIYGIYVVGSSMEPKFDSGDLVYVDATIPPRKMDYVIAQLSNGGGEIEAYIKRYIGEDETDYILQQFNPKKELRLPKAKTKLHKVISNQELTNMVFSTG